MTLSTEVLRLLCAAEACADSRIDNDMTALSKLTKIATLLQAVLREQGHGENPFYPPRNVDHLMPQSVRDQRKEMGLV